MTEGELCFEEIIHKFKPLVLTAVLFVYELTPQYVNC